MNALQKILAYLNCSLLVLLLWNIPSIAMAECKLFTTNDSAFKQFNKKSNKKNINNSKSDYNFVLSKALHEEQTIRTIQLGAFAKPDLSKYTHLLDIG